MRVYSLVVVVIAVFVASAPAAARNGGLYFELAA
jgi:hypothetical protein